MPLASFTLQLDAVTETRKTKKVDGEKVRVKQWAYKFKSIDDGTTVTVKVDEEQDGWIEDESFELTVGQRTYQVKLPQKPADEFPKRVKRQLRKDLAKAKGAV